MIGRLATSSRPASPRKEAPARPEQREPKTERRERGESQKKERQAEPRTRVAEPRPSLPDDVSTTLFVSVGRNRRVYPRDLIGLILQTTGIDRDHVGEIRVLDNYSFVQVITEDADKIIEMLNETEYRGRKLTVSHSKKREDGPCSREEPSESDISEGDAQAETVTDIAAETADIAAETVPESDETPEATPDSDDLGTDPAGLTDSQEDDGEIK